MKKVLITGITGQDGSYLAELLLEKGYEVYGLIRRVAIEDEQNRLNRILPIMDQLHLVSGSMESYPAIYRTISKIKPDEVYHLAAQSFVSYSFDDEFSTLQSNIGGTHFMLSAVKDVVPNARFYFAATSEMFGAADQVPQNERTVFHPRSAYGISKVAGFDLTRNYREAYKLFACSGILYNHESERRGFEFVTRKITSHVAKIKLGLVDKLQLGNLDSKRDWGHAEDYVVAMWLMLQQEQPDDYVIATNNTYKVRDFVESAFKCADIAIEWEGEGVDEKGVDRETGRTLVEVESKFFRPSEVNILKGDYSKALKKLDWKPKVSFEHLIQRMVENDIKVFSEK